MTQLDLQIEQRLRGRRGTNAADVLREIGALTASVFTVAVVTGLSFIGFAIPAFGLLFCLALALAIRALRERHGRIALQYVEQAVRQNLPLPAMLHAAASGESGGLRRQLLRLAGYIESGATLGEAMERSLPGIPRRNVALIDAAEQLGILPVALARLIRRQKSEVQTDPVESIYLRWYPVVLVFAITAIWGVFIIFVAPKLQDIFRDFRIQLPLVSRLAWGDFGSYEMPILIIDACVAALVAAYTVSEFFRPSGRRTVLFKWITDRIAWFLPICRSVVQNRDLAEVCLATASALEIGQPADAALLNAAQSCGNRVMQFRVVDWAANISAGLSMSDAATQAKLPTLLTGMLATVSGPTGTIDALRFLGRYYDSRGSAVAAMLRAAAIPVMTLCFAFVVLIMVLGIFLPMVELINAVTPHGRVR